MKQRAMVRGTAGGVSRVFHRPAPHEARIRWGESKNVNDQASIREGGTTMLMLRTICFFYSSDMSESASKAASGIASKAANLSSEEKSSSWCVSMVLCAARQSTMTFPTVEMRRNS